MKLNKNIILLAILIMCIVSFVYWKGIFNNNNNDNEWNSVEMDYNRLQKLQEEVNEGHHVSMLSPEGAAIDFTGRILGLSNIKILNMEEDDEDRVTLIISTSQGKLEMCLKQPITTEFGIWSVYSYRWVSK